MPNQEPSEILAAGKRRKASNRRHGVYLVTVGISQVKIGHSGTPAARLSELQVGSAHQLTLAKVWQVEREAAKALERKLHLAFKWAHLRGEWFAVDHRAVEQVGDMYVAGRDADALAIAEMLRQLEEIDAEEQVCRRAWYDAKPKDRRTTEAAAALRREQLEVESARLTLALMDLGFHPPWVSRHRLQVIYWRRRYEAIVRDAQQAA